MAIYKSDYESYLLQNGHYSKISNLVWELKDIDVYTKVIWAYLVSQRANWASSRNNLSRNLDISPRKVTRSINELKKFNMIKVITGGGTVGWSFEIIPPDQWLLQLPTYGASGAPQAVHPVTHTQYPINNNIKGNSSPVKKANPAGLHTSVGTSATLAKYIAQGKTPADFGGMSVEEAAAQRDYANSFPTLDTTIMVKEWEELKKNQDKGKDDSNFDSLIESLEKDIGGDS